MSQSMSPTRPGRPASVSERARAQARFTAKVDFPTPPLPLATATMCFTPPTPASAGALVGGAAGPVFGTVTVMAISGFSAPSDRSAASMSA